MSSGVVYFNHGTGHLVRLAVSLHSLRKVYGGPIAVFDTGEGIATDNRFLNLTYEFDVQLIKAPIEKLRRHSCYVTKAGLWRLSPYNSTVYLDADTLICRPLDLLFEEGAKKIVLTRFAGWTTETKVIRQRIETWRDIGDTASDQANSISLPKLVHRSLSESWPAVNTGVFAFSKGHGPDLGRWQAITAAGWKKFIPDEIGMQLLLPTIKHTLLDDRYNCSPTYGVHRDQVVIWHFHGGRHLRKPEGRRIWEPAYQEVLDANPAKIRDWRLAP